MGSTAAAALLYFGSEFRAQPAWAGSLDSTPGRFFVSLDGDDSWTGTLSEPNVGATDGPFATPLAARDAARSFKALNPTTDIEIVLREGTYYLDDTLVLTPEDSGTEEHPVTWTSAEGESVVLSAGRELTGTWSEGGDGVWSLSVPGAWGFRSLFVDGERATLARFPKADPVNPGSSYLYNGGQNPNLIVAGLAHNGDFVEYEMTVPSGGTYDLWVGFATTDPGGASLLELSIDSTNKTVGTVTPSANFRSVVYSKLTSGLSLTSGTHTVRLENISPIGEDHRFHLDAFVLTNNSGFSAPGGVLPGLGFGETRVVVQAEDDSALTAGYSSITFQKFSVASVPAVADKLYPEAGLVKATWAADPEARVDVVGILQYFNEITPITNIDGGTGVITVSRPAGSEAFQASNYFFVSGVREELTDPDEWYLDNANERLDYLPPSSVDPNTLKFVAPKLQKVLSLEGNAVGAERVEWIVFSGITFAHANGSQEYLSLRSPTDGAVKLDCAKNNRFEDCVVTATDGYGFWLHLDSQGNVFESNEVFDTGIGGFLLSAAQLDYGIEYDSRAEVQNYAATGNKFLRNHVHDGGKTRVIAAGFNLGSRPSSTVLDSGNLVAFNHIHDMPRQGLFGFRNQGGNVIAYNHIHDVLTQTSDAGAINIAGMTNLLSPNLVIGNYVHDASGQFRFGEDAAVDFGYGLYEDHGTSEVWAANNVFVGVARPMLANGGQFNSHFNNIFADRSAQMYGDLDGFMRGNMIRRNIIASVEREDATVRVLAGGAMLAALSVNPRISVVSDNNLLWSDFGPLVFEPQGSYSAWQATGNDANSVNSDPLFTDPANGDYSLQSGSPAVSLGFQELDLSDVGPGSALSEPDLSQTALVRASIAASVTGPNSVAGSLSIPDDGFYRLFSTRPVRTVSPQKHILTVDHAEGTSKSLYSEWNLPGANMVERFGLYLGTYPFTTGGTASITLEQPGSLVSDWPSNFVAIRVPRLTTSATGVLWNVIANADKGKLAISETASINVSALDGEGQALSLSGATITFSNDAPTVVSVSGGGTITALAAGISHIVAKVVIGDEVLESDTITVISGDVLWEVNPTLDDLAIAPLATTQLNVAGVLDTGSAASLSGATITYASANTGIATISSTGLVSGVADGTVALTATVTVGATTIKGSTEVRVTATAGPLLWYGFDESSSGSAAAGDGGASPAASGTFVGAATRSTTVPGVGSLASLDLTGSGSSYVTPGVSASAKVDSLATYSFAMWVKLAANPAINDRFISKGSAFQWTVSSGTASALVTSFAVGSRGITLPAFDGTVWNFFGFVGDGATLRVYRGTTSSGMTLIGTLTSTPALPAAASSELRIGGTSLTSADRTPPAYIDDVRIFGRTVTISELNAMRLSAL